MEIGPPVREKKNFKGFYHIWAWRPSWSCHPNAKNKLSFTKRLHIKFGFDRPSGFREEDVCEQNDDVSSQTVQNGDNTQNSLLTAIPDN